MGKDLVEGAIVAVATTAEPAPGVRVYKVLQVHEYPPPFGCQLDLVAYDPKAPSFEEAAAARRRGKMTVAMAKVEVPRYEFLKLDHRVVGVEPVSEQERHPATPLRK